MHMNIAHLKYAVEIANTKSISKAAENLYMGQPNLSRAIKSLEETLGIEIFKRSSKGIRITPEGEEFLGYARQMLAHYQLMEARYVKNAAFKKKFSVSMQHYTFAVEAFIRMAKAFDM